MNPDAAEAPASLHRPQTGPAPAARVPAAERWQLANGLRIVAVEQPILPQVALRLTLPAGSAAEPTDRAGLAGMTASLLTEGTKHRSADELNALLDALAAAISVSAGHDVMTLHALLLTEVLDEALPLIAEIVTQPAFPPAEIERIRAETLDALVAREDEPAIVADDAAARALFGAAHPYARTPLGTEQGVQRVRRAELQRFHAQRVRPGGSHLVVAGRFDAAALRAQLDAGFAQWSGSAPPPSSVPLFPELLQPVPLSVPWEDAVQAEIRIATRGLDRRSPEWIAAAVANYILGGSTITGRLGANLREDKGWTYGVRSAFGAGLQPAGWIADTSVDAEVASSAVREIRGEMRRLGRERVPDDELRRAKDALILSLPRAFETPGRIVGRFATVESFGLGGDYWARFPAAVEAVSAEDVQRIARTHFDADRAVTVVLGAAGSTAKGA